MYLVDVFHVCERCRGYKFVCFVYYVDEIFVRE